ncbi:MAG: aspartate-semialdehyde dehydrogenase [Endomicrobium sp.]|jgi:aspartate-semialdehyde dehydrogenase|nr:aspartate-semialdehyde dehydrogenase [Endomicrobium sp.]
MRKFKLAVVGATGAVGREMINMLEKREFPIQSIRFFASHKSVGKKLIYRGKEIQVELLNKNSGKEIDIALFSAGSNVSKEFAPYFILNGCYVIDNSNAWRMDTDVPLVVPEVNSHVLKRDKKLIANPNCSTIQMVIVLKPIHDYAKVKRVIVSTYQSVSGAGQKGIDELTKQIQEYGKGKHTLAVNTNTFKYQIAFNVIPQIDIFMDNNYTKEEMKMTNETKKIMNSYDIEVSATCVRVPIIRAHSESVWIETEKTITPLVARNLLCKANGICIMDDPNIYKYPMPILAEGQQITYVGRIRQDISLKKHNALTLWIVSDNLLKGAALNAVQIAEELIKII